MNIIIFFLLKLVEFCNHIKVVHLVLFYTIHQSMMN